ncbi:MAG: nucleoside-diphosphate sugar epimerase/dehydratase, partial [Promethearchaeota archaeon]
MVFTKKISKRKIFLLLGDLFIIFISLHLTYFVRFGKVFPLFMRDKNVFIFLFFMFTFVVTFYIFDLYNVRIKFFGIRGITFFLGASAFVLLLGIGWFYLFPFGIGRGIFIISFSSICILSFLWRIFFSSFFRLAFQKRNVLVVGTKFSRRIPPSLLLQNPEFRVVGFVANRVPKINYRFPFQYLGKINNLK